MKVWQGIWIGFCVGFGSGIVYVQHVYPYLHRLFTAQESPVSKSDFLFLFLLFLPMMAMYCVNRRNKG